MGVRFVCPMCLSDIHQVFALPPVRPLTTCRTCGHRVRRTAGSVAKAWAWFFGIVTAVVVWPALLLLSVVAYGGNATQFVNWFLASLCLSFFAIFPAAVVGWAVGFVVAAFMRAPDDAPPIHPMNAQRIVTGGPVPSPFPPPGTQRPRASVKTMRCWHCGCGFDVKTSAGPTFAHCPQCKAGLGLVSPS